MAEAGDAGNRMKYIFAAMLLLLADAALADGVATVKPLHSLVAAVMQGSGDEPVLLVAGAASPHTFQLAPSQMRAIEHARVVFAVGAGLEPFLAHLDQAKLVIMAEQPGVRVLPARGSDAPDPHLWLDPANARAMVDAIVKTLSMAYPQNAALYRKNGDGFKVRITALDAQIRARMQPLAERHFIVFHDALQYFERAYGLHAADSISLAGEPLPGAAHLSHLHALLASGDAVCVLDEPGSGGRLVHQLAEGTKAHIGMMDPEAQQLAPGADLYLKLLAYTADQLEQCLKR